MALPGCYALTTVLVSILLYAGHVESSIQLPSFIDSSMVLQRDTPLSLSGWSNGTTQQVYLNVFNEGGNVFNGSASVSGGQWVVKIPSFPASGPYTFEFSTNNVQNDSITLTDVMFGDVWLCSGQSNMQFSVSQAFNASEEIAAANYPNIRMFTVARVSSSTPMTDVASCGPDNSTETSTWRKGFPYNLDAPEFAYFSAACYFFGRDLYETTLNSSVSVGLIESDWGGTFIQSWAPESVMEACKKKKNTGTVATSEPRKPRLSHYQTATSSQKPSMSETRTSLNNCYPTTDPNADSVLYNAMIHPLVAHNVSLKGILWYQAEANLGQADQYACWFPGMIKAWREAFQDPTLPFLFVQVSTWLNAFGKIPDLRNAQLAPISQLPNVGVAYAYDIGDLGSPYNNIHPRNKQTVGKRLSAVAASLVYNTPGIAWVGPVVSGHSVTALDSSTYQVNITFGSSLEEDFLQVRGCEGFSEANGASCLMMVLVADKDGNEAWGTLESTLSVDSMTLQLVVNTLPSAPVVFTYNQVDIPTCAIYNRQNFPLIPFVLPLTS